MMNKYAFITAISLFLMVLSSPGFTQTSGTIGQPQGIGGYKSKPTANDIPPPPLPPSAYGYTAPVNKGAESVYMKGAESAPAAPVANPTGYYSADPKAYYPTLSAATGVVGTPAQTTPELTQQATTPVTTTPVPAMTADPKDPCSQYLSQDGYAACQDRMMKLGRMQDAKDKRQKYSQDITKRKQDEEAAKVDGKTDKTGKAAKDAKPVAESSSGTEGVTDQMILDALKKLKEGTIPPATPTK